MTTKPPEPPRPEEVARVTNVPTTAAKLMRDAMLDWIIARWPECCHAGCTDQYGSDLTCGSMNGYDAESCPACVARELRHG